MSSTGGTFFGQGACCCGAKAPELTTALADAVNKRAQARSQAMTHEVARIGQLEAVEQGTD